MYSILVVDDEQIEREGVCYLLRQFEFPFQAITKKNGREALDYLENHSVDVILSDIKMPFLDGLSLCKAARELYPDICLILLTAFDDFTLAKQAIRVQVDDYLLKPVILEEFEAVLSRVLQKLDQRAEEQKTKRGLLSQYRLATPQSKELLLAEIMRSLTVSLGEDEEEAFQSGKKLVREVLEIMHREYASELSLATIAERLHVSKGYLSTLFKQELSLSVMQYLTMMRMQKAQQLLLQTKLRVSDVAEAVGYHDFSYFGLMFKKIYGKTPAQYREGEIHG